MDDEYENVQFQIGDMVLAVRIQKSTRTAWVSKEEMSILYARDRSVVSRHIKNIYGSNELDEESNVHFLHKLNSGKSVAFYSLDTVISVGYRVKSKNGFLLKRLIEEYFRGQGVTERAKSNGPIVVFENGNVSLPVRVSPEENTVWLDKDGPVSLFGTTRQNVEYHIANIYGQGELEEGATCKEILQVKDEAERKVSRLVKLYNLDLIISLGYRINGKNYSVSP